MQPTQYEILRPSHKEILTDYFPKIPTKYNPRIDSQICEALELKTNDDFEVVRVNTSEGNPILNHTLHNTPIKSGEYHLYTFILYTYSKNKKIDRQCLFKLRVDEIDAMDGSSHTCSYFVKTTPQEQYYFEFD